MEIGRMDQKQNKENNFLTERRVDAEAVHTHRRIAGAWSSYVIRLSVALLCILAASLHNFRSRPCGERFHHLRLVRIYAD